MGQLVTSLNTNRNQTTFLPTRFLDFVTAAPVTDGEESSIDAAFIALALHNYKSQPTTPVALRDAIDTLENRFDFSAFTTSGAFGQAYFPTGNFGCCTYSGFTNENKIIAMAAELSDAHHVPLESQWNKDTGRALAFLADPDQKYLVYSFGTDYRAPFVQALANLFVDTSERGVDNYPDRALVRIRGLTSKNTKLTSRRSSNNSAVIISFKPMRAKEQRVINRTICSITSDNQICLCRGVRHSHFWRARKVPRMPSVFYWITVSAPALMDLWGLPIRPNGPLVRRTRLKFRPSPTIGTWHFRQWHSWNG